MKLGLIAAVSSIAGALAFASFRTTPTTAEAADACVHTEFKTEMVRDACKAGGQDEAKKQMKAFLKDYKATNPTATCNTCHSKVGGAYPLKPDGLQKLKDAGKV